MFIAFAPPATTEPPRTVANISQNDGRPPSAMIIAGIVVTTSRPTMRGFVRRTYARTVARIPASTAAGRVVTVVAN